MKTIGLIGGLGPPSTVKYYEWLNEGVNASLGGHHFAKIVMTSVDGDEIRAFREAGDVDGEGRFFAREAQRLERAGADLILIASNTSHRNAHFVRNAVSIPMLHLADATADRLNADGLTRVGLLGTALTMESDFYRSRLAARDIEVLTPAKRDREYVSATIYDELVKNIVRPEANVAFVEIIDRLAADGAQAVVLGCTELTLLDLTAAQIPLLDTVRIHVDAALTAALG